MRFGLILLCSLALLAACAGGGTVSDPLREYYRAVYDMCRQFDLASGAEGCMRGVRITFEGDWYHQSSPGFVWPLDGVTK